MLTMICLEGCQQSTSLGNTRKSSKQGKKTNENGFKMYCTSVKLNTMQPLKMFSKNIKDTRKSMH